MNRLLAFAAGAEALTGAALMVAPSIVGRLLLGADLSGVTVAVSRVAGIALVALGVACWPGKEATRTAGLAMLIYSGLVALYFLYLGIHDEWVGVLLWPAAVLHAILALLLARAWFETQ